MEYLIYIYLQGNLISPHELHALILSKTPNLRILNSTWYMPAENKNAKEEHQTTRIQGALYFDIDDIADKSVDLPHMLPKTPQFVTQMKDMKIRKDDQIVCYDNKGIFSSPRAW